MKSKIITFGADSLPDLQAKTLGYNHDHSKWLYFGLMKDMPFKYIPEFKESFKYCAVIEEYLPNK